MYLSYLCDRWSDLAEFAPRNPKTLKLCRLGEIELAHFHGRHHHVERLFPTGAGWDPHCLNVLQHVQETLVETKVSDTADHLAILDQECAVAGHASEDFLVGINFADVPQPGYPYAALGGGDHLLRGAQFALRGTSKHDIERSFTDLAGQRKAMAGGPHRANFAGHLRRLHALCTGTRVRYGTDDPILDQLQPLPPHPFAVERNSCLQRVIHVVPDGNVLAE